MEKRIYPGESADYRAARDSVLQLELNARRALEEAAAARRRLPAGPLVPQDYVFEELVEGQIRKVKMSELFVPGQPSLAIYSWMFSDKMKRPCPMCSGMLDSWDGIVRHVKQRLPLAIVADSPIARLREAAKERGWAHLRMLSTAGNAYNKDYFGVTASGSAIPNMNVFKKDAAGIHHFWGTELVQNDVGQDSRNLDTLNPIFQMLDLAPEGRGDFYTKLEYPTRNSL